VRTRIIQPREGRPELSPCNQDAVRRTESWDGRARMNSPAGTAETRGNGFSRPSGTRNLFLNTTQDRGYSPRATYSVIYCTITLSVHVAVVVPAVPVSVTTQYPGVVPGSVGGGGPVLFPPPQAIIALETHNSISTAPSMARQRRACLPTPMSRRHPSEAPPAEYQEIWRAELGWTLLMGLLVWTMSVALKLVGVTSNGFVLL
jgi:hypothetical protein